MPEDFAAVEAFVAALGPTIILREQKGGTYYVNRDTIELQRMGNSEPHYYALVLHECAHWSGHPTRLNRRFGQVENDMDYCIEELTAIFANLHLCTWFDLAGAWHDHELPYAQSFLPTVRHSALGLAQARRQGREAAAFLHRKAGATPQEAALRLFRSSDCFGAAFLTSADAPLPTPARPAAIEHLARRYACR